MDNLNGMIKDGNNFGDHIWGCVEGDNIHNAQENDDVEDNNEAAKDANEVPRMSDEGDHVSGLKKCKKKQSDHCAETRKKKLLCQRVASTHGAFDEHIKSFLKGMFEASFSCFEQKIDARLQKLEEEISELKETISTPALQETQGDPPLRTRPFQQSSRVNLWYVKNRPIYDIFVCFLLYYVSNNFVNLCLIIIYL